MSLACWRKVCQRVDYMSNESGATPQAKVEQQIKKAGLPTSGTLPFVPQFDKNKKGEAILEPNNGPTLRLTVAGDDLVHVLAALRQVVDDLHSV